MKLTEVRGSIDVPGSPTRFFQVDISASEVGLSDDQVAALIGDGAARLTVSLDMADKNFGSGFGAHVSVSLTTNQDEDSLRQAHAIATGISEEFLLESFNVAKDLALKHLTPQRD